LRAAEEGKKDITKAWDGGGREEEHNESMGWRRKGRRTQRKHGMAEEGKKDTTKVWDEGMGWVQESAGQI
jgi:hypothetical protein